MKPGTGSPSAAPVTIASTPKEVGPGVLDSLRLLVRDLWQVAKHHAGFHSTETFREPIYDEYGGTIGFEEFTECWICCLSELEAERAGTSVQQARGSDQPEGRKARGTR